MRRNKPRRGVTDPALWQALGELLPRVGEGLSAQLEANLARWRAAAAAADSDPPPPGEGRGATGVGDSEEVRDSDSDAEEARPAGTHEE